MLSWLDDFMSKCANQYNRLVYHHDDFGDDDALRSLVDSNRVLDAVVLKDNDEDPIPRGRDAGEWAKMFSDLSSYEDPLVSIPGKCWFGRRLAVGCGSLLGINLSKVDSEDGTVAHLYELADSGVHVLLNHFDPLHYDIQDHGPAMEVEGVGGGVVGAADADKDEQKPRAHLHRTATTKAKYTFDDGSDDEDAAPEKGGGKAAAVSKRSSTRGASSTTRGSSARTSIASRRGKRDKEDAGTNPSKRSKSSSNTAESSSSSAMEVDDDDDGQFFMDAEEEETFEDAAAEDTQTYWTPSTTPGSDLSHVGVGSTIYAMLDGELQLAKVSAKANSVVSLQFVDGGASATKDLAVEERFAIVCDCCEVDEAVTAYFDPVGKDKRNLVLCSYCNEREMAGNEQSLPEGK